MNFDEIVVKESPGLCRCCLSEGCYKDLSTEYTWMNETEVYADMLLECFDISISQHNGGPNGGNRLICEVCITRLRDACNFKKQVLDSEKKFVDLLARGEFQPKVIMYQATMKAEELLEESIVEDAEVEYLDEGMDYEDDLPLKQPEAVTEASVSDVTVESLKVKGKRGRPRKTTSVVKTDKRKVPKIEEKPRTSKTLTKGEKPHDPTLSATKRNRLMKRNAVIILEHSTVIPFKWHRQNYLCFFCHQAFKDHQLLKLHTQKEHQKSNIRSAVSYLRRDEKVKIDVSALSCRICKNNFDVLDSLIEHIKLEHNQIFSEDYGFGIIPYRLFENSFQCAVCGEQFQYFIKLNQHMNYHFGNYVCENCGKSFLSQDRLRCHSLSHGSGFRCNECPEIFDSLTQKNQHEARIHNRDKTLKCFYCPDTFTNYNQRKKHHHSSHNVQMPEFNCPICGKTFQIMSKMRVHVKEVHIREKNYACTMCDQKFFSKTHVQKHMIKHFGERVHQCEVCMKSYARKQTLRDHMRIHSNEKRFICSVCSQGFVQNNSLRLHMRVHHPDTVTA
ncbi:gastrula zinc finger protein XlCGF57.1-like isoform X4 [Pectinophora gossypiella]|nr:gastrula zinc finger protein XlCGF57.1-like isoform X4 [Pectinophora gossypiella]